VALRDGAECKKGDRVTETQQTDLVSPAGADAALFRALLRELRETEQRARELRGEVQAVSDRLRRQRRGGP